MEHVLIAFLVLGLPSVLFIGGSIAANWEEFKACVHYLPTQFKHARCWLTHADGHPYAWVCEDESDPPLLWWRRCTNCGKEIG